MFGMPGGIEWIIILVVALLIFGRRLPEVMRSMGKGIVEFKKGIKGIENEVENESSSSSKRNNLDDAYNNKDKIKD
ncbi:MAG: Sec-independent protein translocase subunit TatA/TatB [Candidatus Anammoxibacter sp.]